MSKFVFDKSKHGSPMFQYSLDNFYYVVDKDKGMLLIFRKKDGDVSC